MLKEEFEKLAMRGHGTITGALYDAIEEYYMSDSYYHKLGGTAFPYDHSRATPRLPVGKKQIRLHPFRSSGYQAVHAGIRREQGAEGVRRFSAQMDNRMGLPRGGGTRDGRADHTGKGGELCLLIR